MDSRAPKYKGERTKYENKEYLPGKWHKEDKKKIGMKNVRPEDKIKIQEKLDAALKKLKK